MLRCSVDWSGDRRQEFIKTYHRKHWLDRKGDSMRQMCNIVKIKVANKNEPAYIPYKTREELKNKLHDGKELAIQDLNSLPELQPPDIMPNGNVGTPSKIFLQYIKECRLPPVVIKNLGLTFPRTKCKKYGQVPFDYGGEKSEVDGSADVIVFSGKGDLIESENPNIEQSIEEKKKQQERLKEVEDEENEKRKTADVDSGDDDDSCEEWERHEAMYDDPSNQERNKERLFEEEIELKWEKGGSGLVFYTDAQYWQEKEEGDFDEQTADDWDVDMSVYYEKDGGDKDSRDYVQMRREKQRREGHSHDSVFNRIGKFEKYTKGIGRKIMEHQGWTDGRGLGTSVNTGISDALDNEGQNPRDKSGFGYRGEKLNRYVGCGRKRRRSGEFTISTIYDDPSKTDPPEPVLRRTEPYHISHRPEFKETFKS